MNGYANGMVYGVPVDTWNSWAIGYDGSLGDLSPQQQLWLDEYNRTDTEQDYHTMEDKSLAYKLAYTYTGIVDTILGTESVETGERVNDDLIPYLEDMTDTGKQYLWTALLLGGLYVALK